jgi:FAD/FMN-containing dehydrogenase
VLIFPLNGALNRQQDDYSAVGNRNARSILNVAASWERSEDDGAQIGWCRAAWEDLRRYSTGGTYVNFLTAEEAPERVRAAYGGNWERLARVKAEWDPENFFRQNKNIPPA